ncbi:hypothetical protein BP6252_09570 [Coleophoma cylindrospora]|uniref:Uncharacterized protein n=1 Tax=Coleophoma cylindrospora TaxID=1849047 RepID=A0A3D8R2Y3_9HELO|nr:hypothetical protein BP6252_09570 [Coleophoma cylindrospora]
MGNINAATVRKTDSLNLLDYEDDTKPRAVLFFVPCWFEEDPDNTVANGAEAVIPDLFKAITSRWCKTANILDAVDNQNEPPLSIAVTKALILFSHDEAKDAGKRDVGITVVKHVSRDLGRLLFDTPETGFQNTEGLDFMHSHFRCTPALSAFLAKQNWNRMIESYTMDVKTILWVIQAHSYERYRSKLIFFMAWRMIWLIHGELTSTFSFSTNAKSGLYVTKYYSSTISNFTQRHKPRFVGDGNPIALMGPPQGTPPVAMPKLQHVIVMSTGSPPAIIALNLYILKLVGGFEYAGRDGV